jgi:hypothetical protein
VVRSQVQHYRLLVPAPGRALVLDNGRLVGFLTLSTVMRHLRSARGVNPDGSFSS